MANYGTKRRTAAKKNSKTSTPKDKKGKPLHHCSSCTCRAAVVTPFPPEVEMEKLARLGLIRSQYNFLDEHNNGVSKAMDDISSVYIGDDDPKYFFRDLQKMSKNESLMKLVESGHLDPNSLEVLRNLTAKMEEIVEGVTL